MAIPKMHLAWEIQYQGSEQALELVPGLQNAKKVKKRRL